MAAPFVSARAGRHPTGGAEVLDERPAWRIFAGGALEVQSISDTTTARSRGNKVRFERSGKPRESETANTLDCCEAKPSWQFAAVCLGCRKPMRG
jgi:hypothetical protein